jgi:hypothetical protein
VIGDVTAAIHWDEFSTYLRWITQQIGGEIGGAAVGKDVGMFK